jgi:hypothetical protein
VLGLEFEQCRVMLMLETVLFSVQFRYRWGKRERGEVGGGKWERCERLVLERALGC